MVEAIFEEVGSDQRLIVLIFNGSKGRIGRVQVVRYCSDGAAWDINGYMGREGERNPRTRETRISGGEGSRMGVVEKEKDGEEVERWRRKTRGGKVERGGRE